MRKHVFVRVCVKCILALASLLSSGFLRHIVKAHSGLVRHKRTKTRAAQFNAAIVEGRDGDF